MRGGNRSKLGLLLIVAGFLVAMWPVGQRICSQRSQEALLEEYEEISPTVTAGPDEMPDVPEMESGQEKEQEEAADDGPFVLVIQRLQLRARVMEGVEPPDLAKGPGFYPHSPPPGSSGNVSIAAHRLSYGAWFRDLDKLTAEDEIVLESPSAIYTYRVESIFTVADEAWEVVAPTEEPMLTLTTCHPPGSIRERLVVQAGFVHREDR